METVEKRLARLEKRIDAEELHGEAVWLLLKNLYILTSPQTGISPDRLKQFVTDLKNEAPDDELNVPPAHQDRTLSEIAPHFEGLVDELIEALPKIK
nr:hypothetical protein [uncultured Rhodopila sp.]